MSEMVFLYEKNTRWFGLEGVEAMILSELCAIDFSASELRSSCLEEVTLSRDEHKAGVLGMSSSSRRGRNARGSPYQRGLRMAAAARG
jgi:hypothetical protein